MKVGALSSQQVHALMAANGLSISIPPITVRIRSPLPALAEQMQALYHDYALVGVADFAHVDIRMLPVRGWREWTRPQVQFVVDGIIEFPRTYHERSFRVIDASRQLVQIRFANRSLVQSFPRLSFQSSANGRIHKLIFTT